MKNYKSLSVYKDRDVYIFGASGGGEIVKDFLECHDVPICAFVDSNKEKWGASFFGYEVISPKKLQEDAKVNKNVLVQIASSYENEIRDELKKMNITDYISFSAFFMLKKRKIFELFQQDKEFYKYYLENIVLTPKETKELWGRRILPSYTKKVEQFHFAAKVEGQFPQNPLFYILHYHENEFRLHLNLKWYLLPTKFHLSHCHAPLHFSFQTALLEQSGNELGTNNPNDKIFSSEIFSMVSKR